jgi:hypothetical protein
MEDETAHDEFRALCTAVGFIVLNWGMAEQQLDIWVNIAFRYCGGEALRPRKGIPRTFKEKAEFLNDCFKKLPALAPLASEGRSLVERVSARASKRNDLVHGSLASFTPEKNGAFRFNKVGYEKDGHTVSTFMFSPKNFSRLETVLGDLLTEQTAFGQKLADRFPE